MADLNRAVMILYGLLLGKSLSHEDLIEKISQDLCCIHDFRDLSKSNIEEIAFQYEYQYGTKTFIPGPTLIENKTDDSWLKRKKEVMAGDSHKYESRYKDYLIFNHYGEDAANEIIFDAEKVLSLCADPNSNERKRGLVIGDVQSGKTSNYLALANLACDYGYKIILILAGLTDSLRIQTQERTDEGLVGAISSTIGSNERIKYIGVGLQNIPDCCHYAVPLTTDLSDFANTSLNFTSNDLTKPQILVVKKNKSILTAVKKWLKPGQTNISSKNILIIDDECDNASVNTRNSDDSPSTINGLIRDIYNNFTCSSYVGYTATPFANIFINPEKKIGNDDLFPNDFIHRLKSSNNKTYFGIDKVFRNESTPHRKRISDEEENKLPAKHKKDVEIPILWDSLKNAICLFLICNVVRTLRRDETKHRSMMINVSPYNKVQSRIEELVEDYVIRLRDAILQYDKCDEMRFIKHKELLRIYNLYNEDTIFSSKDERTGKSIKDTYSFEEIKSFLFSEISKFRIALINNKVKGDQRFKYKDYEDTGARVITIGGFVLSRGLTLEGLMTSYYSRNSTSYDTLLQMCRWFGYRPNYEDLCSVYMTQISYDCFGAISDAVDNLDTQLEMMAACGKKPKDFGLMVQESPDTLETDLLVTARNKMKNSYEKILGLNYSGVAIDTSKLYIDFNRNNRNIKIIRDFIAKLKLKGKDIKEIKNRFMILDVSNEMIAELIQNIDVPFENRKFDSDSIASFIRKSEFYDRWDVVFASGERHQNEKDFILNDNYSIPPVHRSFSYQTGENIVRISKRNNRLLDPGIFNAGLTDEQLKIAKESAEKRAEINNKKIATPIAEDYLDVPNRKPLLVILPIMLQQDNPNETNSDYEDCKQEIINRLKDHEYLVGIGIGFAGRQGKVMMRFRINKVKHDEYLRKFAETEDEVIYD